MTTDPNEDNVERVLDDAPRRIAYVGTEHQRRVRVHAGEKVSGAEALEAMGLPPQEEGPLVEDPNRPDHYIVDPASRRPSLRSGLGAVMAMAAMAGPGLGLGGIPWSSGGRSRGPVHKFKLSPDRSEFVCAHCKRAVTNNVEGRTLLSSKDTAWEKKHCSDEHRLPDTNHYPRRRR